ncbi:MAG: Zinc transporter [Promethearchaeota archaeon]|jgi:zinc and cadmium transporter|nr:MAG: Zinc transporter [Candidatus Lokiarchaeota archaeon]
MNTLFVIILFGFLMSLIAWIGLITLSIKENILRKILLILVAFSAGALLGGAFLHLVPESIINGGDIMSVFIWLLIGFSIFFLLEQFLQWQHQHRVPSEYKPPVGYLILVADGLHNFIGGLAIASSFMVSFEVGVITWIAAAAHEIPQELGDFGVLLHSGWKKRNALIFNFLSALTIIPGGIITFYISGSFDTTFLLPFAAGNFLYIAASDLIPEIKHGKKDYGESVLTRLGHFFAFIVGIFFILLVRIIFG